MAVVLADSTWNPLVKGGTRRWLTRIHEQEIHRRLVWSPLFLAFGIFLYFGLSEEPPVHLVALLTICASLLLVWKRMNLLVLCFALTAMGFGLAGTRSAWLATPMLTAYEPDIVITGWVYDLEQRGGRGGTIGLDVEGLDRALVERPPRRVSLTLRARDLPSMSIGDKVQVRADLWPLPRPAAPGAFDYARQLYFRGIGAQGQGADLRVIEQPSTPLKYHLRRTFHDLRNVIGERIRNAVRGPLGSVAEALITGERANIPKTLNESLQASGLFHILSISGLHMSLVVGGAFWLVRAVLAASPVLALRRPIKKWAAASAFAVGLFYNLLADSGAATERSFIMIAVMLFAVMVDRPAISLNNLAVAAMIVLLREPEQAVQASFQMSFMAVMGLAAFFPHLSSVLRFKPSVNRLSGWTRKLVVVVVGSLATSIIAGGLSSIPALHHFGRIAPFGVVANALALPVVSIVVMPMAVLSTLLMPLGLEAMPLAFMVWGLDMVMGISNWVASWPLASSRWQLMGAAQTFCLALACALLCLPASPVRWLALPVFLLFWAMPTNRLPAVLFDERGANAAILTEQGYAFALAKSGSTTGNRWLRASGDSKSLSAAALRPGWHCAESHCLANTEGWSVAYLTKAAEMTKVCPTADIILAAFPLRRRCKGNQLTVDRFDVWRDGTVAVYNNAGKPTAVTARSSQGNRPWTYTSRPRTKPIINRKLP